MKIEYTEHLKNRLKLRNIEEAMPRMIVETSGEHFVDVMTGNLVVTGNVELYGKTRNVMVAYVVEDECMYLLTIHPLKDGQKESRIGNGRWRKIV